MPPKKSKSPAKKSQSVDEKYQKVTPIEHVLLRPEMYVGSKEEIVEQIWHMSRQDAKNLKLKFGDVQMNHALLKIVDEILLNASDNANNDKPMTYIHVSCDDNGRFTVENDGSGIPIEMHSQTGLLVPEMVFGHLLTSSNYSDNSGSLNAGRHGYGAKLTNIMSKEFSVECVCGGKIFKQKWTNNMRSTQSATVGNAKSRDYTKVSFTPDYEQFGLTGLTKHMRNVMMKRVLDLAVTCPGEITVKWNGITVHESFDDYVASHSPELDSYVCEVAGKGKQKDLVRPFKFAIIPTMAKSRQNHTTINGIVTYNGGTHANFYTQELNALVDQAVVKFERANPSLKVKAKDLKSALSFVALVTQPDPKFDSQSKTRLVSKHEFTSIPPARCSEIVEYILSLPIQELGYTVSAAAAVQASLDKGVKKSRKVDVPKLIEAPGINGRKTLIVTEGDSAKSLAVSSLSAEQKLEYSVFPLRGKIFNVRSDMQKLKSGKTAVELQQLFMAMGLKLGERVDDVSKLRHQRLMIMCDQDADGSHIKGLLISAFHFLWPELCAIKDFITIFKTPLLKVFPNNKKKDVLPFYTKKEYTDFMSTKAGKDVGAHTVKYYKGLGTSTTKEGKEYFSDIKSHTNGVKLVDSDKQLLDNVFCVANADWRKQWLTSTNMDALEPAKPNSKGEIKLADFVNTELVEYGIMDNMRMIPNVVDGLKASQRKILWASLRKPANAPSTRVSQLSGHVSEVAMFHHGEASLQQTIIKMAQDFTGSNNINLLQPEGQFGSRLSAGNDSAAPRYIFTKANQLARSIFPEADDPLLDYVVEEEATVEPKNYVPIIPFLPLNGQVGIGVGFMVNCQMFNPIDIIDATEMRVNGNAKQAEEFIAEMVPFSQGFRGEVRKILKKESTAGVLKNNYAILGHAEPHTYAPKEGGRRTVVIRVTEIPWYMSTENFREHLVKMIENNDIQDFNDFSGENHVDVDVFMTIERYNRALAKSATNLDMTEYDALLDFLGLYRTRTNTVTYLQDGHIVTSDNGSLQPIFDAHYPVRLEMYAKRKALQLKNLDHKITKQQNIIAFTDLMRNGKLNTTKLSVGEAETKLHGFGIKKFDGSYNYLLNQPMQQFMKTNIERVQNKLAEDQKAHAELKATAPSAIWLSELAHLRKQVTAFQDTRASAITAELKKRALNPKYTLSAIKKVL